MSDTLIEDLRAELPRCARHKDASHINCVECMYLSSKIYAPLEQIEAELTRLREVEARCAADTTAVELRQQVEFVRTVLDRHAEINAARERPEQQVYDLISEVRYQLEPTA